MDKKFRDAQRTVFLDSSPANIAVFAREAIRAGVLQPMSRGEGRDGRRFSFLAAQAHLAAEKIGSHAEFDSCFPQWSVAKREYKVRRLLARCLIGGLDLKSLRILMFDAELDIPVETWSPGGEGFDEIIRPLDYTPGEEYTEMYIVYQSHRGELSVTLLDCIAEVESHRILDEDGNPDWEDRLDSYVANAYHGFVAEDLEEEDFQRMARDMNMEAQEIASSLTHPTALAQAAFDYHHHYGADEINSYPITFNSPAEVRRHFMLELVMSDRGLLR